MAKPKTQTGLAARARALRNLAEDTPEFREVLKRAQQEQPNPNSLVDSYGRLDYAILEAEESFLGMADKVPASVSLGEWFQPATGAGGEHLLTFCQVGKPWGLWYSRRAFSDPPDDVEYRSITTASGAMKERAAERLPDLLEAMREIRDQKVQRIHQLTIDVLDFAVRVREEEPRRG